MNQGQGGCSTGVLVTRKIRRKVLFYKVFVLMPILLENDETDCYDIWQNKVYQIFTT